MKIKIKKTKPEPKARVRVSRTFLHCSLVRETQTMASEQKKNPGNKPGLPL